MKKKISILLCALMMILSLVGCSVKSVQEAQFDETQLQGMAEFIVGNFSQMSDEDFEQFKTLTEFQLDYTLMQSGLKIEGKDFLRMIDVWEGAEEEYGEYLSHGDYEIEVTTTKAVVSALGLFENGESTISFTFENDMTMKALDIAGIHATGGILANLDLNMFLGLALVLALVVILVLAIALVKGGNRQAACVQPQNTFAASSATNEMDDLELVAVITAAIAAQEGTSVDGFVVRSIRRRPSNKWN